MNALAVHSSSTWHELSHLCSTVYGSHVDECDALATEVAGALAVGTVISLSAFYAWMPLVDAASAAMSWLSNPSTAIATAASSAAVVTPVAFAAPFALVSGGACDAAFVVASGSFFAALAFAAFGAVEVAAIISVASLVSFGFLTALAAAFEAFTEAIASLIAALAMACGAAALLIVIALSLLCLGAAASTSYRHRPSDKQLLHTRLPREASAAPPMPNAEEDEPAVVGRARLYPDPLASTKTPIDVVMGLPIE